MSNFSLSMVRKTKSDLPPRILIHGGHKIGKSTFANMAPSTVFIPAEPGQEALDAQAFPLCQSWDDVIGYTVALINDKHDFKTVALDSMDWIEKLLHAKVCEEHKKKSIEDFGYGKGYTFAQEKGRDLLDTLDHLRKERGMGVIGICHSEAKRFDDPLSVGYDRWQMKLHKGFGKMLAEWADVIGFAQIKADTVTETKNDFGKTKRNYVMQSDQRVLHLAPSPGIEAGSRWPLPAEIPLDYEVFAAALAEARK